MHAAHLPGIRQRLPGPQQHTVHSSRKGKDVTLLGAAKPPISEDGAHRCTLASLTPRPRRPLVQPPQGLERIETEETLHTVQVLPRMPSLLHIGVRGLRRLVVLCLQEGRGVEPAPRLRLRISTMGAAAVRSSHLRRLNLLLLLHAGADGPMLEGQSLPLAGGRCGAGKRFPRRGERRRRRDGWQHDPGLLRAHQLPLRPSGLLVQRHARHLPLHAERNLLVLHLRGEPGLQQILDALHLVRVALGSPPPVAPALVDLLVVCNALCVQTSLHTHDLLCLRPGVRVKGNAEAIHAT